MAELSKTTANQQSLRKATTVYPQPIAIAAWTSAPVADHRKKGWTHVSRLARLLRATWPPSLSQLFGHAMRLTTPRSRRFEPLVGPLSFGHFLGIIQRIAGLQSDHPLAPYLSPFRKKRRSDWWSSR